jgi:hypothetical protein
MLRTLHSTVVVVVVDDEVDVGDEGVDDSGTVAGDVDVVDLFSSTVDVVELCDELSVGVCGTDGTTVMGRART